MEERVVNDCLDANPTTSVHGPDDFDYCSLPYPDRHKVATAVLNLSRAESSNTPLTRVQASRGMPSPQRKQKLLPRMHRRFLKSKLTDGGSIEAESQVNTIGSDDGRDLWVEQVVGSVPESVLEEDDGYSLELNLGDRMGSVEEDEHHSKCGTVKPQLRDLNFVLIDTEQETVQTMSEVLHQGTACWYCPHQEGYTLLRPRASLYSTQSAGSSGFDRGTQHPVQPNLQNFLVQRAGEDVVAITMRPLSQNDVAASLADSSHILKITDTLHDFTFPTGYQSKQGWGSVSRTEDFLQLACIPVCANDLGFGGGDSRPPVALPPGAGGTLRPHGKSPADIFMERGAAELRNLPVSPLNPANRQSGITAYSCPGFRWNTADTLPNSSHEEISLNDMENTSPAYSRHLARKRRGRRYLPVKSSRKQTVSNMVTSCTSFREETQVKEREVRQQHRRSQRKKEIRRHRRQQSDLLFARRCNTTGPTERTGVSEVGAFVSEHEPKNLEKCLANIRIMQDALVVRRKHPQYSESDKENFSPQEKNLEVHVPAAEFEQQGQVLFADKDSAEPEYNVCDHHQRSCTYEDERRQVNRLQAGEGPSRDGEQLIDVNQMPDDPYCEKTSAMNTWAELLRLLNASERRCQNLLEDNENLIQLNLSLKEQLFNLVENYKATLLENASLLEMLRSWQSQELDGILDACTKLV